MAISDNTKANDQRRADESLQQVQQNWEQFCREIKDQMAKQQDHQERINNQLSR